MGGGAAAQMQVGDDGLAVAIAGLSIGQAAADTPAAAPAAAPEAAPEAAPSGDSVDSLDFNEYYFSDDDLIKVGCAAA